MKRHIVVGTGGHIDHGKTALVKAMTGTDTDRLKEEQDRGITIELGFAFLTDDITIIDVPGHEKFVRTMVAGVSTIDIALLVIAADDGAMPQTVEHLDVLRYLNVKTGLIALTKTDLADLDWLEMVEQDIEALVEGTFLEGAKIIKTSTVTGEGFDDVRAEILRLAEEVPERPSEHVFRFPIDRVFSMKGFGTVVTGTILSGQVKVGDQLCVQPTDKEVRVRGIQVHESEVNEAFPGFRAGINITGASKDDMDRGHVLVTPGYYKPTYMLDVRLNVSKHVENPVTHWQRVRFHIGTSEILARVVPLEGTAILPGESGLVQLRLESPTICEAHDRFVIRQYAPMITIGGGEVLEPYAKKMKKLTDAAQSHLEGLESGSPYEPLLAVFAREAPLPLSPKELQEASRIQMDVLQGLMNELLEGEEIIKMQGKMESYYITSTAFEEFSSKVSDLISSRLDLHRFLDGIELNEIKEGLKLTLPANRVELLMEALEARGTFKRTGTQWAPPDHHPEMTDEQRALLEEMTKYFQSTSFESEIDEGKIESFGKNVDETRRIFSMLETHEDIIRIAPKLYITKKDRERAFEIVKELGSGGNEIRVGDLRERLRTTRKFALPYLQYLDRQGITSMADGRRFLRSGQQEVNAHGTTD